MPSFNICWGRFFSAALMTLSLLSCYAQYSERLYKIDSQIRNKVMVGDALETLDDVKALNCARHCKAKVACGFFFHNENTRKCVMCSLCGNITLVDETGWDLYTMEHDKPESAYDDTNICPGQTMSPTLDGCWDHSDGSLKHVSVGPAGAWGVNLYDEIFYREGTYQAPQSAGTVWRKAPGFLVQIDLGTDIAWGVNSGSSFVYRSSITASNPAGFNWPYVGNDMTWISVSPGGSLWAVDTSNRLLHRRDSSNALPSGTTWDITMTSKALKVDAGQAGVWALDTAGQLYYRLGTYGDTGSAGTEWRAVDGPSGDTLDSVSSGKNLVVVVDVAGRIWLRTGLGPDTPGGLTWVRLSGHLKQLEVYETDTVVALWGVNFDSPLQLIYFKTLMK